MPVRPPPITYRCPACEWSHTVVPRSDALAPDEIVEICPVCGSMEIEQRTATAFEGATATVIAFLHR